MLVSFCTKNRKVSGQVANKLMKVFLWQLGANWGKVQCSQGYAIISGPWSRRLSGASQQILSRPWCWRCCQHNARYFNQKLQWRHSRYYSTYAIPQQSNEKTGGDLKTIALKIDFSGLSFKYSIVGLEARRRCYLLGRIEVGFHRSELLGAGIFHDDG